MPRRPLPLPGRRNWLWPQSLQVTNIHKQDSHNFRNFHAFEWALFLARFLIVPAIQVLSGRHTNSRSTSECVPWIGKASTPWKVLVNLTAGNRWWCREKNPVSGSDGRMGLYCGQFSLKKTLILEQIRSQKSSFLYLHMFGKNVPPSRGNKHANNN